MASFTWHTNPVPNDITIRQIYGFCFDEHGRLLMLVDGDKHNLPGGRPESYDVNLAATLTRECIEEVNVLIRTPIYLGFQLVDEGNGTPLYAQVRMVAVISEVRPARPDPDTGKTYRRLLIEPASAGELLRWGYLGHTQVKDAQRIAINRFGLPQCPKLGEEFI